LLSVARVWPTPLNLRRNAAPVGAPWFWTLAFGHHEDRTPTHGYAETRDGAMAAFAKAGGGNDLTDVRLLGQSGHGFKHGAMSAYDPGCVKTH
jgi:hypothetical protein